MAARANSSPNTAASNDETVPLLRPMSAASVGTLCIFAVAGGLTAAWCLMDGWNRDVTSQLFDLAEVTKIEITDGTADLNHFKAPVLLAFLQFVFMAMLFSMLFFFLIPTAQQDLAELKHTTSSRQWAFLIFTHVFSIFWLQALMMPSAPMSLGLFAASRSLEVPIAAFFRAKVFDTRPTKRDLATPVLMFAAAWLLFYSYSQLAHCLCIWSGFGVELGGPSLVFIYLCVLAIPPANYVCQESVMTHSRVRPLLLLAGMNLGACFVTLPCLLLAHFVGWEDQRAAWQMIYAYPEVYMLILWLCVQMAATCAFAAGLIYTVNSFWAVSLKSMRVVFWWCRVLLIFYFTSGADLLSTSLPNESFWSFVMFCGCCFLVAAISTESTSGAHSAKQSPVAETAAATSAAATSGV